MSKLLGRVGALFVLFAALLVAAPVWADAPRPFTQDAFARAQAAGKAILVVVHADWCPVCKRMKPVEDALLGEAKNKDVVAFVNDFDRQSDALKTLNVRSQATQVMFKGAREVGRHSFVADGIAMQALIDRAGS